MGPFRCETFFMLCILTYRPISAPISKAKTLSMPSLWCKWSIFLFVLFISRDASIIAKCRHLMHLYMGEINVDFINGTQVLPQPKYYAGILHRTDINRIYAVSDHYNVSFALFAVHCNLYSCIHAARPRLLWFVRDWVSIYGRLVGILLTTHTRSWEHECELNCG